MKTKYNYAVLFILLITAAGLTQKTLQEEQDFRFAVQLENKELYDIAALQFERFAELYPNSTQAPEALFRAGQNYGRADSLAKAANAYLAVLLRYPQSTVVDGAQFNQAQLLLENKEFLKAAVAFDRLKILASKSSLIPEAQIEAAHAYLKGGDIQKAYDAALYFLENFPTHPMRLQAYEAIADVHAHKGDYMAAIQSLDRILADRVQDDFAATIYTKKSRMLQKLGRYTQADSVLLKLVRGNYGSPIIANAANELARTMQAQRQYVKAQELLENAIDKVAAQDKIQLWLSLGDNYFLQNQFSQAKQTYLQLSTIPQEIDAVYFYRLGLVNKQLNDVASALAQFEHVLADTTIDRGISAYAAVEYAELLALDNRAVEGVRYLQDYVAPISSTARRNMIFMAIANISENYLNDYAGARKNYNAIMAGSSKNAILDDAQFYSARSYEREGQLNNALGEYKRYLQYFPGGDFYATSKQKADFLNLIAPVEPQNLDNALNEILLQGLSNNSQAQALYSLAQYQIRSARDFEKALDLLNQAENANANEQLNREKLEYDKALCNYVLCEMAVNHNRPGDAQKYAQQLDNIADRMRANYPASYLTSQVEFWATQTILPTIDSTPARVDLLNNSINNMQNDSLKQLLQIQLVDEMVSSASDSASNAYNRASNVLNEVINRNGSTGILSEALYKQALLLHKMSYPDSAIGLLNRISTMHESPRHVDALYLLATIYQHKGRDIDAQRLYYDIAEKYFYSPWAARAEVKLISLMLKQGQHKEAQQRMAAREQAGVPRELQFFYPEKVDDEALWLWAELTRQTKSPQEAVEVYQKYLELGEQTKYRANALFAIGELADEMNKQEMALGYFEECANMFPTDSLGQQALVKTADLYFDRGIYEKARERYAEIRQKLSGDLQKQAFQQLIICDYRLGRLNRAESLAKDFKKTYDDRNAEARFLYEEGMHYITTKDFSRAEKTLKNLANRYDDVPEGARGDLGLARLYVIQTKTEDALERLTEIPQKYKNPDVVATAYLNLADFYYENRALENTIHAGQQVLKLKESGAMRAQALDLLINAYDDLGLRDQAIAYEREYIETYPYASDILDRRIRIGTFLYYLKEYDRAIVELKEVQPLVSADDEARVQFWIAESYAGAGFTEQSIIEYLKVRYQCKQHPKLPFGVTALYKAGEGYQKIGNLPKAREMFEIVVRERGATDDFGRAANRKLQEIDEQLAKKS